MKSFYYSLTSILCASLLYGCAKNPVNPQDPYENFNRNMFKFNTCLDKILYRPVAKVYNFVTPKPIQDGVTRVFNNVEESTSFTNDFLQGKFRYALIDVTRFVVNSSIGIGGFFDVASHAGLPRHPNDFGKTFAYYSTSTLSPYIVLPFLGPSTMRDAFAIPANAATTWIVYINDRPLKYALGLIYYVNLRSSLLPMDKLMYEAFDPYAALRDAYLQHRNALVLQNAREGDYRPGQVTADLAPIDVAPPPSPAAMDTPPPDDDFSFGDDPKAKHTKP